MTHTVKPTSAVPYQATLMTAEELMATPVPNKCTELVAGRMIVSEPPGFAHGVVAARLLVAISSHVSANTLGVTLSDSGYTLFRNPDTVRAPDVSFIRAERVPQTRIRGYADFAPDLAVEVLSPSDRAGKVLAKVGDWIEAGALLVWIVDPERRTARVYRPDGTQSTLTADDSLDGEDVLPGFSAQLSAMID
ncbi:MAG: Uma2 family endonuclease [Gemmatimonadaceae bacterium]|nr:Uma2 family endonuclease [Gemmatimonadaceae bacterium]